MANRPSRAPHHDMSWDVGTLWTMRRDDHTARCALFARRDDWEVRVLVDGEPTLSERCRRSEQAFAVAEKWKGRLAALSWQQIIPTRPLTRVAPPL